MEGIAKTKVEAKPNTDLNDLESYADEIVEKSIAVLSEVYDLKCQVKGEETKQELGEDGEGSENRIMAVKRRIERISENLTQIREYTAILKGILGQ